MKVTEIKDLLHDFWQQTSDACPLECGEAEEQEKKFSEFIENKLKVMTFEDASSYMMKYLSENHHPHVMAEIESNRAVLWEGQKSHLDDSFIQD
jgi:hypothetical protein